MSNLQKNSALSAGHQVYVPAIDGLRAIAVCSVVLYHADTNWVPGGFSGVDIFYFISGFVVSRTTFQISRQKLGPFLLEFYRRRLSRILPAALLFILVTQILAVLFVPVIQHVTNSDIVAVAATVGGANIALWATAGDYFSAQTSLDPYTHMWSLGVEEQFYFIFPFIACAIWGAQRKRPQISVGLLIFFVAASLLFSAYYTVRNPTFSFYMLPTRFWQLGTGMGLFLALEGIPPLWRKRVQASALLPQGLAALALVAMVCSMGLVRPARFPFPDGLIPGVAALTLIFLAVEYPKNWLCRVLSMRAPRFLGTISYSLYLWHWGIDVLLRWTLGMNSAVVKIIAVIGAIALAWLSYRLIEAPARRLGRQMSPGQVIFTSFSMIFISQAAIFATVQLRSKLSLSETSNRQIWDPTTATQIDFSRCAVRITKESSLGGQVYELQPTACKASASRLFVLGDSHAGAYVRLASIVAKREAMPTTVFTHNGCTLIEVEQIAGRSKRDPQCAAFINLAVTRILRVARPGDVIFLPGLRIARFAEHEVLLPKAPDSNHLLPSDPKPGSTSEVTLLRRLSNARIRIIVERPKPVFRFIPNRCSDWFNSTNEECRGGPTITKLEILARRSSAITAQNAVMAQIPGILAWDPLPVLCPGIICNAYSDGKPLVSDGDHLTGYANELLWPSFISTLHMAGKL